LARIIQPEGRKGSLKWLQRLVNYHPNLINQQLSQAIHLSSGDNICWLSPLTSDEYAEYRDASFTRKLGITLNKRSRESFWPERGPQWDALGKTDSGKVILLEAKSHLEEIVSPGTKASRASRGKIIASLEETKAYLRAHTEINWAGTFYQYTNRLAHLYLLRILNRIDSYLVFVYFMNDHDMQGPKTKQEWQAGIKIMEAALGLKKNKLSPYIVEVFIDIGEML